MTVCTFAGALYPDGTGPEDKRDDSVAPGGTVLYEWTLSEQHSPIQADSNCLTRFYHSHVSPPKDIDSGLIGPLLICKKGTESPLILDVEERRSCYNLKCAISLKTLLTFWTADSVIYAKRIFFLD